MSFDYEDVKTTIKDHPVETVAVVATVGLFGAFLYQRHKRKEAELELAMYKAMQPSRKEVRRERRQIKKMRKIAA